VLETKTCVFCGRRPTTVEDIVPIWLRELWTPPAGAYVMGRWTQGRFKWVQKFSVRAKILCRPCNGDWLGKTLEDPAAVELKPLIQGASGSLTPTLQRLVGIWCVKTVLLTEYAAGRRPAAALLHSLYLTKLPQFMLSPHGLKPPSSRVIGNGVFSLMVLGHVVVITFVPSDSALRMVFGGPTVTQVWPVQLATTSWPMAQFLEDEKQIDAFHTMVDSTVQRSLPAGWSLSDTEQVVPDPKGPQPHPRRRP
jgi:hypothetical protein